MIASTRPCETTECISLPRPVSDSTSTMSISRQRAPFSRYPESPSLLRKRVIESSENSELRPPSELSITTSTSASLRDGTPWPPAKITSCMVCPRMASGDCSPSAHSTASVMFDLPEPFGPMTTAMPGPNSSRVRFGNDLKPLSVSERRCMWSVVVHRRQCSKSCGLLRGLLAFPCTTPDFLPLDLSHRLEAAVVRGPLLGDDYILDNVAAARQLLLQQRFEVVGRLERLLDLARKRLHDHRCRAVVAVFQVHRPDQRLADRCQHAVGVDELLRRATALARMRAQPLGKTQVARHLGAGPARYGLRAQLGQPAGAGVREAREQIGRHRQAEHAVPQERQPVIRLLPVLDPGGMHERLAPKRVR